MEAARKEALRRHATKRMRGTHVSGAVWHSLGAAGHSSLVRALTGTHWPPAQRIPCLALPVKAERALGSLVCLRAVPAGPFSVKCVPPRVVFSQIESPRVGRPRLNLQQRLLGLCRITITPKSQSKNLELGGFDPSRFFFQG